MIRPAAAPVSHVEQPLNPLLTPEQTPHPDVNQSVDLFAAGAHEAVFTIVNGKGIKEQVEEVVMTRKNHLRNGEDIALVERQKETVIHQTFNVLVSVQAIISDLRNRGIATDLKIKWDGEEEEAPADAVQLATPSTIPAASEAQLA